MTERKYSVAEIDRMRAALEKKLISHGIPIGYSSISVGELEDRYRAEQKVVEDQLRTYMLNGTEPEELEQRHLKSDAEIFAEARCPECGGPCENGCKAMFMNRRSGV